MKGYLSVLIPLILGLAACKPYNSTEKNKELLQGKWLLKEIRYANSLNGDSDHIQDTVYLSFTEDTIIEQVNRDFSRKSLYNIKGYKLEWLQEDSSSVDFNITLLTDSTFSMRSAKNSNIWMLIKEKTE